MTGRLTGLEGENTAAAIVAIVRPAPGPKYRSKYLSMDTRSAYPKRERCHSYDKRYVCIHYL
jgi:hypothetical protein